MSYERTPADRPQPQSPEELLTPETYQLATAMANRLARESRLDYPDNQPSDGNFSSALHEALAIGQAAIALQRLEDPTAEVNAQSLALWCTQDKVLNELMREEIAKHCQTFSPEITAKLAKNVEEAKPEIVHLTNKTLAEAFAPYTHTGQLQEEVESYLKIMPACQAEAEEFGIPLQKVFENDGLYARAIRASFTPEEFMSGQKAWVDEKDSEYEERLSNDMLAEFKRRGRRFKNEWAEQKAIHRHFKRNPEYQAAVMQFHQESQQIVRNRFIRYWSEAAITELPSHLQDWLRV